MESEELLVIQHNEEFSPNQEISDETMPAEMTDESAVETLR